MVEKTEQLRMEFRTSMEVMGIEMRSMFEKKMIQMKSTNKTSMVELSEGSGGVSFSEVKMKSAMVTSTKAFTTPSTGHVDLTKIGRFLTKLSKLECPCFDGSDFKRWLLKME